MLNLTQQTLQKIRNILLHQKEDVEKQLKSVEADDPLFSAPLESSESGTASWEADVHSRLTAVKEDLLFLKQKIAVSLLKLNKGTYGKCENCGENIELERLTAMPVATLCLVCSRKDKKHR